MSNVTLRIMPHTGRPGSVAEEPMEAHGVPAAISFNEPVRIQLEVPTSAVQAIVGEDGEPRYRLELMLDLPALASVQPVAQPVTRDFDGKIRTNADTDPDSGPGGP